MIRFGAASDGALDSLLERSRQANFNYSDLGMTREDRIEPIHGYRRTLFKSTLREPNAFANRRKALKTWRVHEGAGVRVRADDFAEGSTVLLILGIGPLEAIGPGRIVYVVDEERRFGFAYGTVAGHPERGEQRFLLELEDPGTTVFSILALSRPADVITRLSGPVSRAMQDRVARRYLSSMEHAVMAG